MSFTKKFNKQIEQKVLETLSIDEDSYSEYSKYASENHRARNPNKSKELDRLRRERKANKYDD